MTNNAAERYEIPVLGRKSYPLRRLRCRRTARRLLLHHTETARMNDINPQAYLSDVLGRIADHPIHKIDDLLPGNGEK